MKITIGHYMGIIDDAVLERILAAARNNLFRLKSIEGADFPKSDKDAINTVADLQWRLSEKRITNAEDL